MVYRGVRKYQLIKNPVKNLSYNVISLWITTLAITGLINLLFQCVIEFLIISKLKICDSDLCEKVIIDQSTSLLDVVLILTTLTQAYEWFVMNFIVDHQKVLFIAEAIEEMQDEEKKKAFEKKERK